MGGQIHQANRVKSSASQFGNLGGYRSVEVQLSPLLGQGGEADIEDLADGSEFEDRVGSNGDVVFTGCETVA